MPLLAIGLITLALSLLISTARNWRGLSLTGGRDGLSYALGLGCFLLGSWLIIQGPFSWPWLLSVMPAALLSLGLQAWAGATIQPPPHPDALFSPQHPAHGRCERLTIPDGPHHLPAYLLTPAPSAPQHPRKCAVCLLHGAGDNKSNFKWRLIPALLNEGISVLTLDLPGHGENRARPLDYPDCLSVMPAALRYLRETQGFEAVALYGISLGGAIALKTLAERPQACPIDALIIHATPTNLHINRQTFYREAWRTLCAPLLPRLQDATLAHFRQSWRTGGYVSPHRTQSWIRRLAPLDSLAKLSPRPTLLIYSQADSIAPPTHAEAMHRAAPHAERLTVQQASHVSILLMDAPMQAMARWVRQTLAEPDS